MQYRSSVQIAVQNSPAALQIARSNELVGKRVKFKLMDKRAALVDIGKHLGMFVERKLLGNDPDNPITPTKDMIEAEVDRRIAELERKAGR